MLKRPRNQLLPNNVSSPTGSDGGGQMTNTMIWTIMNPNMVRAPTAPKTYNPRHVGSTKGFPLRGEPLCVASIPKTPSSLVEFAVDPVYCKNIVETIGIQDFVSYAFSLFYLLFRIGLSTFLKGTHRITHETGQAGSIAVDILCETLVLHIQATQVRKHFGCVGTHGIEQFIPATNRLLGKHRGRIHLPYRGKFGEKRLHRFGHTDLLPFIH